MLQSNIYEELPPEYAWVTAAGGTFRGIAADILWARAEKLKEEGKYYELHQLAKWICTLEPRFGQVWQFQAWNMSYNISVAMHTADERWHWVYNGIRLLRDEGIPNNEKQPSDLSAARLDLVPQGRRPHGRLPHVLQAGVGDDDGGPAGFAAGAASHRPPELDWFRPVAEAPRKLAGRRGRAPGRRFAREPAHGLGIDVNVRHHQSARLSSPRGVLSLGP